MPRFDVHQRMWVNGSRFAESKVRMSGDDAPQAAVNWMKIHGVKRADRKEVRILGKSTKQIFAEYDIPGGDVIRVELIPVESTKQCKDCGHPSDAPNEVCYGQCEEFRNAEVIEIDLEEAAELIQDMI